MQPDYDCVVVGAGLVGAAQALALRQHDLSVLVIEARPPLSGQVGGDVRGLVLSPSSQRLIEALGLWPSVSAQVAPIRYIHVRDQGRFGFTHLSQTLTSEHVSSGIARIQFNGLLCIFQG